MAADLAPAPPLGTPRARARVPRLPRVLEAPAHRDERVHRLLLEHGEARAIDAAAHRPRRRRGTGARRGDARGPHVEGGARPLRLHGVRAVPERVPRVEHRQAPLAEAPRDGPARPPLRAGPGDRRREGRRHGLREGRARPRRHRSRGHLVVHDLRGVHAGVPGRHRARGHDRGRPTEPRDGRIADAPGRRADAPQPRSDREPLGPPAVRAHGLGRGPRCPGPRGGRPRAGLPLLGRVRRRVRRPVPPHRAVPRPSARAGRARVRDPRPARALHR